jgi:hypothetical protein
MTPILKVRPVTDHGDGEHDKKMDSWRARRSRARRRSAPPISPWSTQSKSILGIRASESSPSE